MDLKKIILILIVVCVIILGAVFIFSNQHSDDNVTQVNNTTNITKNATLNNISSNDDEGSSSQSSDGQGSESYVERWDRSQQEEDGWAYTHDQPVKTDSDGNKYARVYHEDTGKSTWESMSPSDDE